MLVNMKGHTTISKYRAGKLSHGAASKELRELRRSGWVVDFLLLELAIEKQRRDLIKQRS